MTRTERSLIERALGPVVVHAAERVMKRPDPAAWRALAIAVTFAAADLIIADRKAASMVAALWRRGVPPLSAVCDQMVTGRIGGRDLTRGCFSFPEAWTMAARDLVRTGRAREAEAALRSGMTVRQLLRRFGVKAGPEWDAASERRAFLRTLRKVRLHDVN
jgi:hypothetical protein